MENKDTSKPLPKPPTKTRGTVAIPIRKTLQDFVGEEYDYKYWANLAYWNYDEAVLLALDVDPNGEAANAKTRSGDPIEKKFEQLVTLIDRAQKQGQIKNRIKPVEFMKWLNSVGYSLAGELEKILNSKHLVTSAQPSSISSNDVSLAPYLPPYIKFMLEAVSALGLDSEKHVSLIIVKAWLNENWPDDLDGKSDRLIHSMATMIRRPQDKKGGNTSWKA